MVVEELEQVCLLTAIIVNCVDDFSLGDTGALPGEETLSMALDQAQAGDTIQFQIVPNESFSGTDPVSHQPRTFMNPSGPVFSLTDGGDVTVPLTIDATMQTGFAPGMPQVYLDQGAELDVNAAAVTVKGLGFINHPDGGAPLVLDGPGGDTVQGCVFGLNSSGQAAPNAEDIDIFSPNNTIGGTTAAKRNIVANGNAGGGNGDGIFIGGSDATGNLIEGNYIGTNAQGTSAVGNSAGVIIDGASGNTIGGTTAGAGNLISGNMYGIAMGGSSGNLIEGNLIGTNATGDEALSNSQVGIYLLDGASNTVGSMSMVTGPCTGNTIGGTATGAGNVIAFNGTNGVSIQTAPAGSGLGQSTGNAIEGNLIYGNGRLGINLGDSGAAVPNNAEGHVGPNDFQNYPVVEASDSGMITGMLASPPGTYRIEYFADTAGNNPGQIFLGAQPSVTISSQSQSVNLSFQSTIAIPPGATVVATATVLTTTTETVGDTSEFTTGTPPGLVVNETADETLNADNTPATDGKLSLREAIEMVNNDATPGTTISFDIPGSGVPVISLNLGALPPLAAPGITINAGTQPVSGMVALNGGGLDGDGLDLTGGNDTVQGLVIQDFNGNGIKISGAGGDALAGNFIGTDASGDGSPSDANTGDGVLVEETGNNTIGGAGTQIITGNQGSGIELAGSGAVANRVAGNIIGLDKTGTAVSDGIGVQIDNGASGNTIGGTSAAARNVISGNIAAGVELSNATNNSVVGNYIGVSFSGQVASPNAIGILVGNGSAMNTIGGDSTTTNVISGNRGAGIDLRGSTVTGNMVQANFIGTDASGAMTIPNGVGIMIEQGAVSNLIGGAGTPKGGMLAGQGNVISGNTGSGVVIQDAGTVKNSVLSNFIGTDVDGVMALPNGGDGITIMAGVPANYIGGIDAGGGGPLAGLGNLISGNTGNGIQIEGNGASDSQIEGNFIGTNAAGTTALANGGAGVAITNGASGNVVGGISSNNGGLAGAGNLISGNTGGGIAISRGSTPGSNNNTIQGNFIGTDLTGTRSVGNQNDGVRIAESSGNTVGGESTGTGNLIAGNTAGSTDPGNGVLIIGPGAAGTSVNPGANNNVVIGNLVGSSLTRTTALANQASGVAIEQTAAGNLVGVDPQGNFEGNIISGNSGNGILISGLHATANQVESNFVGTDALGMNPIPNADGVVIAGGANANTVGGTAAAARNVISGNTQGGMVLTDPGTTHNLVVNNLIGTEMDGTDRLANGGPGLMVQNQASMNVIGAAGAGNVISGNNGDGVRLLGAGTTDNTLFANMIGTGSHGSPLGNIGNGVFVQDASGNDIGGVFVTSDSSVAGQGNTISYNFGSGVVVTGAATGDAILSNVIYDNKGIGIDLGDNGITPNDSQGHTGPNNYIDTPVFGATIAGTTLEDDAQVSGKNGQTFLVQFFSSDSRDPANGYSQARSFLGSQVVTITNGTLVSAGFVNLKLPDAAMDDNFILATVTDSNGNTSEFSMSTVPGSHALDPGFMSEFKEQIENTIKSQQVQGKTASATVIIDPISSADVSATAVEPSKKGKSSGSKETVHPTGTVIIEDGSSVLKQAKVKVVRGVSEAQVKLKLTRLGTQTLYVIYQPDAKSVQNGFTPSFTSSSVTVTAGPKRGGKTR
jgi:parallel beta-helix repeat protein